MQPIGQKPQDRPRLDRPDRPRLPGAVLRVGRRATSGYGALTAGVRPVPDYLLIGAKRGGTTSAHFQLLQHPRVLPMFPSARFLPKARDSKGTHFFDSNVDRGERWYRGHFPSVARRAAARLLAGGPVVCGESSPYYLFHPLAADRAAESVPQVKLLVALRNPVERTYSHYREQVRNGVETLSFEDALVAEGSRLDGERDKILELAPHYTSFAHEQQSYAAQSEYADSLERWLVHYPRSSVHVWYSEDYYADTSSTLAGIFDFLGLPAGELEQVGRLNPAPPAPMDSRTRAGLVERFAPDVERVAGLVGSSPPWPDFT